MSELEIIFCIQRFNGNLIMEIFDIKSITDINKYYIRYSVLLITFKCDLM